MSPLARYFEPTSRIAATYFSSYWPRRLPQLLERSGKDQGQTQLMTRL